MVVFGASLFAKCFASCVAKSFAKSFAKGLTIAARTMIMIPDLPGLGHVMSFSLADDGYVSANFVLVGGIDLGFVNVTDSESVNVDHVAY